MNSEPDRLPRLVLAWLLLLASGVAVLAPLVSFPGFTFGGLIGSDSYMRLARVEYWQSGGDWFDSSLPRVGVPEGADLHWTRPLDVVLRLGGLLLAPVLGFKAGLVLFSHLVNPLCLFLAALALMWGLRGIWSLPQRLLLAVLLMIQPAVVSYTAAARIDHHAALLLSLCVAFALLLRLSSGGGRERRWALLLAFLCAFALWLSFEFLTGLFFVVGGLWLLCIVGLYDCRRQALTFSGVLLIALLVEVVIERGPEGLTSWEIDRLSAMHLVIALAIGLTSLVLALLPEVAWGRTVRSRALPVLGAGLLVAGVVHVIFPDLWLSPTRLVDARLIPLWYHKVEEVQPLFRAGRFHPEVAGSIVFALVAVPHLTWKLLTRDWRPLWVLSALGVAIFLPLALYQHRHALFAELFLLPSVVSVADALFRWTMRRPRLGARLPLHALNISVTVALPLTVSVLNGPVLERTSTVEPRVMISLEDRLDLMRFLANPEFFPSPCVVMTEIDNGPMIVFETPHSVVASPYHRNTKAILDGITFFETRDSAEARAIARKRGVDLVLMEGQRSPEPSGRPGGDRTFRSRLLHGAEPYWLEQEFLVGGPLYKSFRLFRMRDQ